MPFHCDDPRTDRWAIETLDELHPMGKDPNNDLVEQVPTISLKSSHDGPAPDDFLAENYKNGTGGKSPLPAWSTDPRLEFQHVTAHQLSWQNIVHKLRIPNEQELLGAGYGNAWFFRPPIVDCPKMLQVRTAWYCTYYSTCRLEISCLFFFSLLARLKQ
jgi:D-amino-acid oxidase